MNKIVGYVKSHPYATGAIVIGGGLAFMLLSGMMGGKSLAATASGGPSDAQVGAEAQIQLAQIQANQAAISAQGEQAAMRAQIDLQKDQNQRAENIAIKTLESQMLIADKQIDAANKQAYLSVTGNIIGQYLNAYGQVQTAAIYNPITSTSTKKGGWFSSDKTTTTTVQQDINMPDLASFFNSVSGLIGNPTPPNTSPV